MSRRISKIRVLRLLAVGGVLCLLTSLVAAGCTWRVKVLAVDPPTVARSSLIYDANGDIITHFRGEQHRLVVQNLDEIPKLVQNAVIAIEDERFWEHGGVDVKAITRAARSNINQGGISEGGSTITQQYVGLTFLDRTDRSTARKVEEIALALQFERLYSKEFILREYLNVVYFGEGAYGIKAAAQEYFSADLDELTVAEAALLAGLIQAPGAFNPYNNTSASIRRRQEVLNGMLRNNWVTQKEFETARTEPLNLRPRVAVLSETYIAPHFVEEVRQWILSNPLFGETRAERIDLLFEGGLHIYTTLNPSFQRVAEAAVTEILPDLEGPDAGVVVIENDTGYIRAMIGGRDFFGDTPEAKFNLATQAGRQAGSAMKPIVLASGLEQGLRLTDEYYAPPKLDIPLAGLNRNWQIEGGSENERVNLYDGLVRSVNTVYAQLSRDVKPENSVEMAERLGFKSELDPLLALVLGSENVTVLDMATAFSTFARRGVIVEPTFLTRIAAADGTLLYEHKVDGTKVLERDISDQLTEAMVDVIAGGTGLQARVPGQTLAGKTGTSENYHDATFSGYSPKYTVSIWVGFPEGQVAMEPPQTPIRVAGGTYPAQIFQRTMANLPQDPDRYFVPPGIEVNPFDFEDPFIRQRVPNTKDLSRVEAVSILNRVGFVTGIVEILVDDDTDRRIDRVISQEPRGGAINNAGGLVTLTVGVLPSTCRKFLELVTELLTDPESDSPIVAGIVAGIVAELDVLSGERIEENLEENLSILEAYYVVPSDCDDFVEAQNEILASRQA